MSALRVGDNLTVYSLDEDDGSCIVVDDCGAKWSLPLDECMALDIRAVLDKFNALAATADDTGCTDGLTVVSGEALEALGEEITQLEKSSTVHFGD